MTTKDEKKLSLPFAWASRNRLRAEEGRLHAEADRLYEEAHRLSDAAGWICVKAERLHDEGNRLWAEAVEIVHGDVEMRWDGKRCIIGGEEFEEEAK